MHSINKIIITAIFILPIIAMTTGCNNKYNKDVSYMPVDKQEVRQKNLDDALTKIETNKDDPETMTNLETVAFEYMNLGKYEKSIEYYTKVLDLDKTSYTSLSNIAYMHEEAGDVKKALEYQEKLYSFYSDYPEVIGDLTRLLSKDNRYEEAQKILEVFSQTEKGKKNSEFITEKKNEIDKANQTK